MDRKQIAKRLFGRILTPSYVSTIIWLLTDVVEVVFLGLALSVILAVSAPLLETAAEVLDECRTHLQARRKRELIETFVPFINAYQNVLAKYPPALLPDPLNDSVTEQLSLFSGYLRQLKGQRTKHHPSPYDMVQTFSMSPDDFQHWALERCTDFRDEIMAALGAGQIDPLRRAVEQFTELKSQRFWVKPLQAAEAEFDHAARQTLSQWAVIRLARQDDDVRQRLVTLLGVEAFHRQAGLQTYLVTQHPLCAPHEVRDMIRYLRYESVAKQALSLIQEHEINGRERV